MKKGLLFILGFAFNNVVSLYAQEIIRDTSLVISSASDSFLINMGGDLDGENTLTRNPYLKEFEPMVQIKMTNLGIHTIRNPRLVFNNKKRWFTLDQMRNECFGGMITPKEKALAAWKFLRDNRIHDACPEQGTNESNDPVKLLGVYGYGMCYNTNYAINFLSSYLFTNGYKCYSPQGLHFVSEMNFGAGYSLIDSDVETFYLKNDNITLASKEEVASDKNLIRRTQHYGSSFPFSSNTNNYISAIYYKYDNAYNWGNSSNFHTLDFNLRPGESIIYDWTMSPKHHGAIQPDGDLSNESETTPYSLMDEGVRTGNVLFGKYQNSILVSKPSVIGNGEFNFRMNFQDISLSEILYGFSGITVRTNNESGPNVHPSVAGQAAEMIVKIESPFVIVDGYLKGKYLRPWANDSIVVLFSRDLTTWEQVSVMTGEAAVGDFTDSISLASFINTESTPALYSYFLKFMITAFDSVNTCGIDSIELHTKFQVSRFFLPSLVLGNNSIEYSAENPENASLKLEIKWKESQENEPPDRILTPIFPPDNSITDRLKFTFSWPTPSDQDEDAIIDYEFQLSDRPDMKFPLSPTFETYVGNSSGVLQPEFTIPGYGLLNHNSHYYWRVRAKDARGAWGTWSPVWSFTPQGVMPPVNASASMTHDSIYVSWGQGGGVQPLSYEIHGSNEWLGFTPNSSTLLSVSSYAGYTLPIDQSTKLFYRIIAVAENGDKSGLSDVVKLAYPMCTVDIDSVIPGNQYSLISKPIPFYYYRVNSNYAIQHYDDNISSTPLNIPSWLSFNSKDTLSGIADSTLAFGLFVDSARREVSIQYTSLIKNISDTIIYYLPSGYVNSSPVIGTLTSAAVAGVLYSDTILVSDKDIPYGDSVVISILNKPSWMSANISGNNIILSGMPGLSDTGIAIVVVSAKDVLDSTRVKSNSLNVQIPLIALFSYNGGSCTSQVVFMDSSNLFVPGDTIISRQWDFGDSSGSIDAHPLHVYSPGHYEVRLSVSTTKGFNSSITDSIHVFSTPAASFSSSDHCFSDTAYFINNSIVTTSSLAFWSWDFGDSTGSIDLHPSHVYPVSGSYAVELLVTTSQGCVSTVMDSIDVFPMPIATLSASDHCFSDSVYFNDSSAVLNDSIASWLWSFGNSTSSIEQNPGYVYPVPGSYAVELLVTTSQGCVSTVMDSIDVFPMPVAALSASDHCFSDSVYFIDNSTVLNDSIVSWLWAFGDSTTSSDQHPTHVYPVAGSYPVQLSVTTTQGCVSYVVDSTNVFPVPYAYFNIDYVCLPGKICFLDSSVIIGGNILSWDWNFGDGNTDIGQYPVHHYDSVNSYIVSLSVTSDFGCINTFFDIIAISSVFLSSDSLNTIHEVGIFPNPSNGSFVVILNDEMLSGILHIYDAIGRLVYSEQLSDSHTQKKEINIQHLPRGLYHLYIRANEKQWRAKVQKAG